MGATVNRPSHVTVVGGGLAGCEATWQLIRRGICVTLIEMKPIAFSPAHTSPLLAELVCSNSLKSTQTTTATGVLKKELITLNSLIMEAALHHAVPAGNALSVDRERFSAYITERLESHPLVHIEHDVIHTIKDIRKRPAILATGPLTHPDLIDNLKHHMPGDVLYFYDATSPIIHAETIDTSIVFKGSRYNKGGDDYLNISLNKEQYEKFVDDIIHAKKVDLHPFESTTYYEGCMPIEVLAERGVDTLAFGPMKPVGLIDPRTGRRPHAVVQLRQEDLSKELYSMVGFQTKMTFSEQERVFRTLPGLKHAEFARFGTIHRNFYLSSPEVLTPRLELKDNQGISIAGQMTGVEGYLESTATGLLCALFCLYPNGALPPPPPTTVIGGLYRHLIIPQERFSPMGANWGLVSPLDRHVKRKEKKQAFAARALCDIEMWKEELENVSKELK